MGELDGSVRSWGLRNLVPPRFLPRSREFTPKIAAFFNLLECLFGGFYRSEKTKLGSALSGALVSTLVGLAASSAGIVAPDASAYRVVLEFLLPVAVPLLLFNADLRRVLKSTGALLIAFLVGSGTLRCPDDFVFLILFLYRS